MKALLTERIKTYMKWTYVNGLYRDLGDGRWLLQRTELTSVPMAGAAEFYNRRQGTNDQWIPFAITVDEIKNGWRGMLPRILISHPLSAEEP